MLDTLEKITTWFCVAAALFVGSLYLLGGWVSFLKLPTVYPREWLPKAEIEVVQAAPASPGPPTAAGSRPGTPPPAAAAPAPAEEDRKILEALRQQNRSVSGALERRKVRVPRLTYDVLAAESNWVPELKKVHAQYLQTPQGRTRMKITRIAEDSLARTLGFEVGDVIELLDGQIVAFDERSNLKYYDMMRTAIDRVREGGTVTVTVSRAGRPVHLMFSLK